jgi:hypothetical protein
MRARLVVIALTVAGGVWLPTARAQHEGDMLIASTAADGGALVVDYDFSTAIVVTRSFSAGGITLYSGTEPGFDALGDDQPSRSRFVVDSGAAVRCEITAIDGGASLQIGGTTIDAVGESALIGTAPNLHTHPSWRLTLPDGVVGDYRVSFRVTGTGGYQPSIAYTATLTNDPGSPASPTPTAGTPPETPLPTATPLQTGTENPSPNATVPTPQQATPTPDGGEACPGDCDGDLRVAVNELVTAVNIALGNRLLALCPAADADREGTITISDLVRAVLVALNGCP